uniref:NADH-ubiquinone oxidoreductase chain 1 n=1 Tax=Vorticeros sp. n. MW-2019 TaxID=2544881 RepID=A0AA50AFC3_9PLAT|nr:NADH dehydrogenase subunit 1 [Vorticeros sp. n. MW-2019]
MVNTLLNIMCWVVILLQLVLVVLFLILLERKIISYISIRKGPNKVTIGGLYQSIADVLKLVFKEIEPNISSNSNFFLFGPFWSLVIILLSWLNITMFFNPFVYVYGVVIIFCLASFHIYILLAVSWGGNSKYALLGGLRASAQVISYEISFFFILFCPLIIVGSYNLNYNINNFYLVLFILSILILCWLVTCLAETNRSPFDFAEGESELVSGFNVEYGALQFGFLYIGEYGSIMLLSYLTIVIFGLNTILLNGFMVNLIIIFFIWARASLPRFRYDLLMTYAWIGILPTVLLILWVIINL